MKEKNTRLLTLTWLLNAVDVGDADVVDADGVVV